MNTKTELQEDTVAVLQYLTQITIDSRDDLREAASKLTDEIVRTIVLALAEQRNQQVSELRTLVSANFIEPENAGTDSATAYRAWAEIRAAIKGTATQDILIELQNSEMRLLEAYHQVLQDPRAAPVEDVLCRHCSDLERAHSTICSQ